MNKALTGLKENAFLLLKFGWRGKVIEMPAYCSPDTPAAECKWTCNSGNGAASVMDRLLGSYVLKNFPKEAWTDEVKAIGQKVFCETAFWPGDHLDAGSPVEASFWVIHPTLDRLYQYKQLVQPFTDVSWFAKEGESYCNDAEDSSKGCHGHHAYDLTFSQTVHADRATGRYQKEHLSNEEVRRVVSPAEYSAPYIYEHFEWAHCSELGVHFKDPAAAT
jgi:hypothetical protein